MPFGVIAMPRGSTPTSTALPSATGVFAVRSMTLIVPSTAFVTYARRVVRAQIATKRGSLPTGTSASSCAASLPSALRTRITETRGFLAIHDDRAIVVAGERDAARARLAEQQLVAHQRFVGADQRAVERGGERGDGGVGAEGGRARARSPAFCAGHGGGDRGVGGGVDLEAVGGVVVGVQQHEQAQQVA